MAGLGEVKISVPEESNEMEIRDLVVETFPKLIDAGGFELMYAEPRKRDLRIIPPGPNGLTIKCDYLMIWRNTGPCQEKHAVE